jgi:hypothetical protein
LDRSGGPSGREEPIYVYRSDQIGAAERAKGPIRVAAGGTVELALQTPMELLPGVVGRKLTLVSDRLHFSTALASPAPHDELFRRSGCAHLLQWNVVSQHWDGIPAGTKARQADGSEGTISRDLASIRIVFDVLNPSDEEVAVILGPTVSGRAGADLEITADEPPEGDSPEDVPRIPAHGKLRVPASSAMKGYFVIKDMEPLAIIPPGRGKGAGGTKLMALPSREALFAKKRN